MESNKQTNKNFTTKMFPRVKRHNKIMKITGKVKGKKGQEDKYDINWWTTTIHSGGHQRYRLVDNNDLGW